MEVIVVARDLKRRDALVADAEAAGLVVVDAVGRVGAVDAETRGEVTALLVDVRDVEAGAEEARERGGGEMIEELSPRERQVLELVAEGLSNRAVAASLGISEHTVKFHLASLFGKLGVTTRAGAVSRGVQRGLIAL